MPESAIPVGTQFAPSLIHLPSFLRAAVDHSGDPDALRTAVWKAPVRPAVVQKPPTRRRASLPLEAAVQYGLLEPGSYRATDLAEALAPLDEPAVYEAFARHVLLRLGGLRVVEAAQQMALDGLQVTGDSLAAYLTDQGFPVTVHNTAINSLRMWLAKAGVFPAGRKGGTLWRVNADAKARLVGMPDATIAALVGLSDDQRAFVEALCRINPASWHPAAQVRDLAEAALGRRVDRGNLPKTFLEPLTRAGLIEFETGGTAGGKTSRLRVTQRFNGEVLSEFVTRTVKDLDAALTAYYLRAPADIYAGLASDDKNTKGEALEAFAIYIMRLLGLQFVAWRKRAREETGRAEVDVLMAGLIGGIATRWQVQCKNKPSGSVCLEDVAKEVGLTPITKATHVLVLANCRATADATTYVDEVMRHSPLTILILDKDDFEAIFKAPGAIATIIRDKSAAAARVVRHGMDWLGR